MAQTPIGGSPKVPRNIDPSAGGAGSYLIPGPGWDESKVVLEREPEYGNELITPAGTTVFYTNPDTGVGSPRGAYSKVKPIVMHTYKVLYFNPVYSHIDGDIHVSVLAHHHTGISSVQFQLIGGPPAIVTEPSYNPHTGYVEWWVKLDPSSVPSGISNVIITVTPVNGLQDLSIAGFMIDNGPPYGPTYGSEEYGRDIRYVDSHNGDDITGDGSVASPFATVFKGFLDLFEDPSATVYGSYILLNNTGVYNITPDFSTFIGVFTQPISPGFPALTVMPNTADSPGSGSMLAATSTSTASDSCALEFGTLSTNLHGLLAERVIYSGCRISNKVLQKYHTPLNNGVALINCYMSGDPGPGGWIDQEIMWKVIWSGETKNCDIGYLELTQCMFHEFRDINVQAVSAAGLNRFQGVAGNYFSGCGNGYAGVGDGPVLIEINLNEYDGMTIFGNEAVDCSASFIKSEIPLTSVGFVATAVVDNSFHAPDGNERNSLISDPMGNSLFHGNTFVNQPLYFSIPGANMDDLSFHGNIWDRVGLLTGAAGSADAAVQWQWKNNHYTLGTEEIAGSSAQIVVPGLGVTTGDPLFETSDPFNFQPTSASPCAGTYSNPKIDEDLTGAPRPFLSTKGAKESQ